MEIPKPLPLELESVKLDPESPRIIIIRDANGQDWRYFQDHRGQLVLGFPYVMSHPEYVVRLFVPLQPGALPILLDVRPCAGVADCPHYRPACLNAALCLGDRK